MTASAAPIVCIGGFNVDRKLRLLSQALGGSSNPCEAHETPGGVVRNVRPNGSPPTDPRARMVYEAARRALLEPRCNPLPLPANRLAALRDTVFRFNPRDLGLR